MNEGKVGAPYEYPDSYVHFLAFLKIDFRIPYRAVQGIVRGLSEYIKIEGTHFTLYSRYDAGLRNRFFIKSLMIFSGARFKE